MTDPVFKSRIVYQPCEDKIYHELTQPSEKIILDRNQKMRNELPLRDLSWGRKVADIPMNMYEKAIRDGYQLNAPDSEVAGREMMRYLRSEEGKLCLINVL